MSNDSNALGDVQNVNRTTHSQIGRNHHKHKKSHGGNKKPVTKEGFLAGPYTRLIRVDKK